MSEITFKSQTSWPDDRRAVFLTRFKSMGAGNSWQMTIPNKEENNENINHETGGRDTHHQNRHPEEDDSTGYPGYTDLDEISISDTKDINNENISNRQNTRHHSRQQEPDESSGYPGYTDVDEISISDIEEDIKANIDQQNGDRDILHRNWQPEAGQNSGYPGYTDIDEISFSDREDNNNNNNNDNKSRENGGTDTHNHNKQPDAGHSSGYTGYTDIDEESATPAVGHRGVEKVSPQFDAPSMTADADVEIRDETVDKDEDDFYDKGPCNRVVEKIEKVIGHQYSRYKHYISAGIKESATPAVGHRGVEKVSPQFDAPSMTADADVEIRDETVDKDEDDFYDKGPCNRVVEKIEKVIGHQYSRYKHYISAGIKVVLLLAYLAYFAYCVYYRYHDEGSYILTVITGFIIIKLVNDKLVSRYFPKDGCTCVLVKYGTSGYVKHLRKFLRYGLYLTALAAVCVYLGLDVLSTHPQNAQALIGVAALVFLCFLFSFKPSRVNWHPVFWGFIIQIVFAILTLRTWAGFLAFKWIGDLIYKFVRLSDKGSAFVFGDTFRHEIAGFFIDSAGVIVFFNACIFVLDNWGVLEFIVLKIGRGLAFCLETGPVESVVAAANIFIGLSEAPLIVRPYLATVTKSELHAIMTCGFASISGAFMAMFIKAGAPANHLLTASVISAPAGLAISKLMYPEVETVNYASQRDVKMRDTSEVQKNVLQACSDGAAFSIQLIGSIMVNMLAFVSLMNLVDSLLVWIGDRAGVDNMTFDLICSYVLWPLSYVMGVPSQDCGKVGSLIGVKMMATPFVAYRDLGNVIKNRHVLEGYLGTGNNTWHWSGKNVILDYINTTLVGGVLSERAEVIATYALCGISAFPAIGFSMGTLIPMCPPRKKDVIDVVFRAFLAGNLANFATGTIAGVMFTPIHNA